MDHAEKPRTRLLLAVVLTMTFTGAVFANEESDGLDKVISLDFADAPVRTILETIGEAGGFELVYDDKVDPHVRASLSLSDISVLNALRFVTRANRMFFTFRDSQPVLIVPDTRQKRQEYMPQGVRVFKLEHADTRTVITVLRSLLQTRQLVHDEALNTITMKDTVEQLDLAEVLIDRMERKSGRSPDIRPEDRELMWIGAAYDGDLCTLGDPVPRLEIDLKQRVAFSADDTTAHQLYSTLGQQTGIEFIFGLEIDFAAPADFVKPVMPVRQALDFATERFGHFWVAWGPRTVFVGPDDRYLRMSEEHAAIQFFYLNAAEPRSVITTLRSMLQIRQIAEIPRLNAVAIRDTVANLERVQELVEGMDRADAEAGAAAD